MGDNNKREGTNRKVDTSDLVKVAPGKTITKSRAEALGVGEDKDDKPIVAGEAGGAANRAAALGMSVAGMRAQEAREAAEDGSDPNEPSRETHVIEPPEAVEFGAVVGKADPGTQAPGDVQATLDDALVRGIIDKPLDAEDYESAAIREDASGVATLFTKKKDSDDVEATTAINRE